jgi:hypothetical protein
MVVVDAVFARQVTLALEETHHAPVQHASPFAEEIVAHSEFSRTSVSSSPTP